MGQPKAEDHWKDRRLLAAALGVGIACFPILAAVGASVGVEHAFPRPARTLSLVLWWIGVLALSTAVYLVAERLSHRAVPLRVLLRMSLAFPDRSPRRLAVARRAASVRDLDRRVAEAREHGIADEPTAAAEKIVTLAAALSAHDRATRGHAERVRALTDMIADEVHLGTADRDHLRWAALLHDVGKLAVHPDILNKPGPLDDEEWEVLRNHPLEGAKLTQALSGWLGAWGRTIAEHHERFDGTGYPAGLAGSAISHGGRIVAVADSYDVMTAPRTYKRPIGPEAARQELAACAGTQFDPEVVRAFLAVSVWRLRFAAPLSWLGALGWTRLGGLGRIGAAAGQALGSGFVAAAGVVALALGSPVSNATPFAGGTTTTVTTTPARGGTTTPGSSTTTTPPTGSTSPPGTTVPPPATTSQLAGSTTTTTVPGTVPTTIATTTTTTLPGTTSTTTTTTTTTSTTTTTTTPTTTTVAGAGPPAPPTDVQATGGCALIVLGPVITVSWHASVTSSVTSYVILRSTDGTNYAAIATVSAKTTSYADTRVSASRSYWYEVEAVAPGGTAFSSPVMATTPPLCV